MAGVLHEDNGASNLEFGEHRLWKPSASWASCRRNWRFTRNWPDARISNPGAHGGL